MPRANASILFSGLSLAILLITILAAFLMGGQGGLILGAAGLTGALFALYGFVIGMIARLCVVSAIVSGLMMIIWLTVFLNGLR